MDLGLDDDDLASCVSCGLCLPHCPTFRVTGDEARSPRGRIEAMRAVQRRAAPVTPGFLDSIDTCVQCRGCETACPSDVPFGRLMESTRRQPGRVRAARAPMAPSGPSARSVVRVLVRSLTRLGALAQRARVVPKRLPLPELPIRQDPLVATGDDAWLFTGCVADAWDRETHAATIRLLARAGIGVRPTGDAIPCCGALACPCRSCRSGRAAGRHGRPAPGRRPADHRGRGRVWRPAGRAGPPRRTGGCVGRPAIGGCPHLSAGRAPTGLPPAPSGVGSADRGDPRSLPSTARPGTAPGGPRSAGPLCRCGSPGRRGSVLWRRRGLRRPASRRGGADRPAEGGRRSPVRGDLGGQRQSGMYGPPRPARADGVPSRPYHRRPARDTADPAS